MVGVGVGVNSLEVVRSGVGRSDNASVGVGAGISVGVGGTTVGVPVEGCGTGVDSTIVGVLDIVAE